MRSSSCTLTNEVACLQACSVLGDEGIGDYLPIPHLPGDPAAGTVQHGASIPCAIRADSVDLQREAIIQSPAHRSTAYGHSVNLPIITYHTDAELTANSGPVMPVKTVYVFRCLPECDRCDPHLPVLPNPPSPRSVSSRLSTSSSSGNRQGRITSCAILSPGRTS